LSQLRGFLGLCNYYEEYVPLYANMAWRLMEKLKVKGPDAKAGSSFVLNWNSDDKTAFENLKKALLSGLSLFQVEPDQPFQIRCDASHTAIGAVLEQERDQKWVPVCFFSRKLTPSQTNWSPREKEAYAIVASLTKWASWIGHSPITVVTDHKSLESWVKEYVETPSGPTGRRARWHEVFSQFNLSISYLPGSTNIPADAMSRYAYPASQERQDVCIHGSAESAALVHKYMTEEKLNSSLTSPPSWSRRNSHESYQLAPHIRDQVLKDLGVPKDNIVLDLFASKDNSLHPVFIDREQNAFTFNWESLCAGHDKLLWANPPFSLLDKVITKVILEPCTMVLVTPEWRDYPWWKPLDQLTISRVYLPMFQPLYRLDGHNDILPGPHWRTTVSLIDSKKWKPPPPWEDVTQWVIRHGKGRTLHDLNTNIMVSTRSGLQINEETESDSEDSDTNTNEPEVEPTMSIPTPPHINVPQAAPSSFKFWAHMSEEEKRARKTWGGRGRPKQSSTAQDQEPPPSPPLPPPPEKVSKVFDDTWTPHYIQSPTLATIWKATHDSSQTWPPGIQIHGDKLYLGNRLLIPESLVDLTLHNFHSASGHLGITKSMTEINHRFILPPHSDTRNIMQSIRSTCITCQAATPPHWPKDGRCESFPVPERLMHSVCLDIFSMPTTQWLGSDYDAILLCVDRLSGWITACPTLKLGLTAENAAHLILDKGWEPFGIPATIHSDMGPQFVGQWWKTMCGRLGIQQTTSQPHRPRANGRAERAGQQLLSVLKKLNIEQNINWVQALPRALRIYHDTCGEGGLSPYHIMFGRDRNIQGIPYTPERNSEDAQAFFTRMETIDQLVATALTEKHSLDISRRNMHKPHRDTFSQGDLVWIYKTPSLSSTSKLEPRWTGPLQVTTRTGEHSYMVTDKKGITIMVHIDQMKPYIVLGETGELTGLGNWDRKILQLQESRERPDGEVEYLILWDDNKGDPHSWVPHSVVIALGGETLLEEYLKGRSP
jgi:hypothetical protein